MSFQKLCTFIIVLILCHEIYERELYERSNEYKVLVRVQGHDAMITNKINLFGLARVEDECKTQTRFIEFVIIPA